MPGIAAIEYRKLGDGCAGAFNAEHMFSSPGGTLEDPDMA